MEGITEYDTENWIIMFLKSKKCFGQEISFLPRARMHEFTMNIFCTKIIFLKIIQRNPNVFCPYKFHIIYINKNVIAILLQTF